MNTFNDYIKVYKNWSFKELRWNDMDNLFCAILSYAAIEEFHEPKRFKVVIDEILNQKLEDSWLMAYKVQELAQILKKSSRYDELVFLDFTKVIDNTTQFGAMTILANDLTIVSFEGSDGTVIGWHENIKLMYMYPVPTQERAIQYLKEKMVLYPGKFVVVGHSKGGNLAMTSVYELEDNDYKRIKQVCNYDGPGFRKEQFEDPKFKRMAKKLKVVLPSQSYIGVLLYSTYKFTVVESSESGPYIHYPNSWECFGTEFVKSKLSKKSKYINKTTTLGFEQLPDKDKELLVESLFLEIKKDYSDKIIIGFKELTKALSQTRKNNVGLAKVFSYLIKVTFPKKEEKKPKKKKEKTKE